MDYSSRQRKPGRRTAVASCLPFAVCCLLLFAFRVPAFGGGTWARQQSGTMAWLHSIYFLDQNRGWVVGSKGLLLATVDGGRSWQQKARPSEDVLHDIYFADAQNGWLVCERNPYDLKTKDEPRTYLLNTSDGGANWNRVDLKGIDIDARLVRTVFTPGGHGWAWGEGGAVFTTHDAGITWARLQLPTRRLLLGGTFVDDDRGWLVGAGGTILQTADGGETWHRSNLADVAEVRFTAAFFLDNRLGWVVGSGGKILQTVNGGRTWQSQQSGVVADLLDVKFLDAGEGWAVGTEGKVIHTIDGGQHWTTEPSDTDHPLERVYFLNRQRGWAVGFGGTIVSYVPAEAPGLTNPSNYSPYSPYSP